MGIRKCKEVPLPKDLKMTEVSADVGDVSWLVEGFINAIERLGGYVYDDPRHKGSDMYGFIVSNKKLTKKQINANWKEWD